MFILGIQGSPQKKGNAGILLSAFLAEAERNGARTRQIEVSELEINPCTGCGTCEKKGFCIFDDDMEEVYSLLRQADLIVISTPIFFYSVPAKLKALIDRGQALWSRRYAYKINDPGQKWRNGFLLALGATKGKNLFEGTTLTAKYFFDAVGAKHSGSLTFRKIEKPGEIEEHPSALQEAKEKAAELVKSLLNRKKVLFVCRENSCRSQMASAFTQYYAGDKIEAESAGSSPGKAVNEVMVEVMKEKGIDMAFRKPKSTETVVSYMIPDLVFSMGCGDACPFFPGTPNQDWNLPDPAGKPIDFMRQVRDEIEDKVKNLIQKF